MSINWFTVAAQVINFLVLVWLLRKFLYKPILSAIDEREKKIAGQIKDAEDKKIAAEKEQEDFHKRNEDFDQQKKSMMDKAIADTNAEKSRLMDSAKNDANTLKTNLENSIQENQANQATEIARKTQKQVFDLTRKALKDIASSNLEEQSANQFLDRLKTAKEDEKKKLIDAFHSQNKTLTVKSGFDLQDKQKTDIQNEVDSLLGTKALLEFKTDPTLISGIELSTNGYKLSWSLSEYLNSLEKNINQNTLATSKTPA
jgi:F-type H+-transporting ATPase subunit b